MAYLLLLLLLFPAAIQILDNVRNKREWYKGLFEQQEIEEGPNYDRLLEAYISIGALMVRKDIASYGEKVLYLNSYFSRYFPETHYHFGRSFTEAVKNPVQANVLCKWLRKRLPEPKQRLQIMYFLAGLATVDGSMNQREIEFLKEMHTLLELPPNDFESIIAMYTQKQERARSTESSRPRVDAVQLACKIIGVPVQASKDEIKKAYRKLVMLHHPDRFATETIEQQDIAEERFLEIQKAYEILEKR